MWGQSSLHLPGLLLSVSSIYQHSIYSNWNLLIFYPQSISLSTVLLLIYYLRDYILFQPWNSLELQILKAHLGLQCKTHCLAGFAAQLLESFPSMHEALHWIHQHFINQGSGTCLKFQHWKVEGETKTPRPSLVLQLVRGQPCPGQDPCPGKQPENVTSSSRETKQLIISPFSNPHTESCISQLLPEPAVYPPCWNQGLSQHYLIRSPQQSFTSSFQLN